MMLKWRLLDTQQAFLKIFQFRFDSAEGFMAYQMESEDGPLQLTKSLSRVASYHLLVGSPLHCLQRADKPVEAILHSRTEKWACEFCAARFAFQRHFAHS